MSSLTIPYPDSLPQAQGHHDDVLAHKFDVPLTHWRRLRDEPVLQRARLLVTESDNLTANDLVQSAVYGVTTDNVNTVRAAADDYASRIVAPHDTIAHRSVLTASLPDQVRALTRLSENIEDILPQFTTPAGRKFTAAYHATAPVIHRGHRFETPESPPAPPVVPPVTPTPAPTP